MRRFLTAILMLAALFPAMPASAQVELTTILAEHSDVIQKGSRRTIEPAINALRDSGIPDAQIVLERWRDKELWVRQSDGTFYLVKSLDDGRYQMLDILSGEDVGTADKAELSQIKPNSGVRALIGAALVQFQLLDPDKSKRLASLDAIQRDPDANQLAALRASIDAEPDTGVRALKQRIDRLLTLRYDENEAARIAAIQSFSSDLGVDARAALNPLLSVKTVVTGGDIPVANIARQLEIGEDLSQPDAYALLAAEGIAPSFVSDSDKRTALASHIIDGQVAGIPVAQLNTLESRDLAYDALAAEGLVAPDTPRKDRLAAVENAGFFEVYDEPSAAVTDAAKETLRNIDARVQGFTILDLGLDGLSLASIYFLAAIGLAITFGVMGVINMAHGEFIMIGAYTGFVVQQVIPDYTVSLIVALPLAFAVTFMAGVALERLVIRWLYNRPLETLLATFGVSIALQQIAKNVFGTQARPLTSPDWLDGAWVINDVVAISWIRVAIFVLGLVFLVFLLFVLNRTRLGLEVRAVTQNPVMAASMGIDPDRIRMLTFGLGSGIAGIAGVAIGLFAKVTSSVGQDYIVQSFMTVVVGGVGNLFGVLAGAAMVGSLQKIVEAFNPSNTLAAQTYMIIFIIIFIQFRPRGIFALKGRAAGM
jgi:urea transport system permease protein